MKWVTRLLGSPALDLHQHGPSKFTKKRVVYLRCLQKPECYFEEKEPWPQRETTWQSLTLHCPVFPRALEPKYLPQMYMPQLSPRE